MKTKTFTNFSIGLWSLVLMIFMVSCTQFEDADLVSDQNDEMAVSGLENARISTSALLTPILWTGGNGGNATCADAGIYEFSSGRNNYEDGAFSMTWPEGFTVNVSVDGKSLSWSFDAPEGYCLENIAVIVKGSNSSHIYKYGPGVTGDTGLTPPMTGGKKPTVAGLSNLTFCYNLTEAPDAPTGDNQSDCLENGPLTATADAPDGATVIWYNDEFGGNVVEDPSLNVVGSVTYWAASLLFDGCESETRTPITLTLEDCGDDDGGGDDDPDTCGEETGYGGNSEGDGSAWWFYFDTQGPASQAIYAGQELTDGAVSYDSGTGMFTIDLGSWSLQDVSDPVKAQGYSTLPGSRPASGLFTLYKGSSLTFSGDGSRYYVIHLDLTKECETE
ncbi:hypothetical protein CLV31_10247 [Algoriphagus aquaeductus]|uniref:Ig-like domain-containing protein n=1 Tax=Algoriphagus aquaeductus TaxID=475299 RepID=A0A326RWW4_9BACT|nr:hypothetical protein [Algoriphagus aquaeductus]PZV86152.1 hypothetical protein CLV31_10247 [Algoriphagus aquaeductus]